MSKRERVSERDGQTRNVIIAYTRGREVVAGHRFFAVDFWGIGAVVVVGLVETLRSGATAQSVVGVKLLGQRLMKGRIR